MSHDADQSARRDPHEVLGVPEGASRQDIVRAFQRAVRSGGHPDVGGDARTFDEIVRARDELLDQAQRPAPASGPRRTAAPGARPATPRPTSPAAPPADPPPEMSKFAIATVVLALLGPLFWPVAIAVGHLARRQIKRSGKGGGTLVPIVLVILYIITIPVLLRVLSVVLIP